ncbi:MAG TPA: hypothetical protein ENH20_00225 [Candidatus Pacearchaeota archaeon]|nr:hypothetical protein [Candidatus Pacearchaeota archaeon]
MKDAKYLLPEKRLVVYVDASLAWVGSGNGLENETRELKRLVEFIDIFKERKGISTAPKIWDEFKVGRRFYIARKNKTPKKERRSCFYQTAVKGAREYNRMIELLRRGMINYPLSDDSVFKREVKRFTHSLKGKLFYGGRKLKDLSSPDEQLITYSVLTPDSGIITADSGMMQAYRLNVKEFGLSDRFVSNLLEGRIERLG